MSKRNSIPTCFALCRVPIFEKKSNRPSYIISFPFLHFRRVTVTVPLHCNSLKMNASWCFHFALTSFFSLQLVMVASLCSTAATLRNPGVIPPSAAGAGGKASQTGADASAVVKQALSLGYRCLDCAQFYLNEKHVGDGIAGSGVPREQLYIISKARHARATHAHTHGLLTLLQEWPRRPKISRSLWSQGEPSVTVLGHVRSGSLLSQVWTDKIYEGPAAVRAQFMQSLADLRVGYFDLYLLHWPVPGRHVQAWTALEQLKAEG